MARKLSDRARRASILTVTIATSLAASHALAQAVVPTPAPANVIENPFVSSPPKQQPKPHSASASQRERRPPVSYQNPFAASSKSPPVDSTLRPGPLSRWKHPVIPGEEKSVVKSAVLSPKPSDPTRAPWDQLPPAENMRQQALASGTKSIYPHLASQPDTIPFAPKPLTQPAWLTPDVNDIRLRDLHPAQTDLAVFASPLNTKNVVTQTVALSPAPIVDCPDYATGASSGSRDKILSNSHVSSAIISDCSDSAEGWLAQAQRAATNAGSSDDLSAVVELCENGMRSGPDGKISTSLRRLGAWAHNRRGELNADAGRTDEALHDFQTAIALDPICSLAIHNRAVTLAQQNQFAAALRDFNRVIELNPGLAIAYRNRAELLSALGRMDEAVADYTQAIEGLPSDAQLYRGRAFAYQRLGNLQNALSDLNRAIEISPNDPDSLTQRGNVAAEQGNYDQAVADFKQAVSNDPNWAEAHRSLAWLGATCPNPEFQDSNEAIAAAEKAVKLSPAEDYLILDTLAAAQASAGHFDQAVRSQQKALACAPADAVRSLEQRLALYEHGQAFRSGTARTNVSASKQAPNASSKTGNRSR